VSGWSGCCAGESEGVNDTTSEIDSEMTLFGGILPSFLFGFVIAGLMGVLIPKELGNASPT